MTNTIAIVGGGISGTLTVLNLIKQSKSSFHIIWFDAKNQFCKGLAYSTTDEQHLLNVRASNMSIFVDEPNHFVNWLTHNYPQYSSHDFAPRKLFGEYVQATFDVLKNTNPLISIQQIAEEVIAIEKKDNTFKLKTTQTYIAQKIVVALGNFLPAHPRSVSKEFIESENYFQNAFHPTIIQQAINKKNITIVGSGLTMIDVLISLHHHSFSGKINIISPHAYIPQAHAENPLPSVKPFIEENKLYQLQELLSLVNQHLKKAKTELLNPQSVIDVMRPHLQFIWMNFSLNEKQQFLRHLRHKWGVARHRAPGESMAIFKKLVSSHIIHLIKGRLYDIKTIESGFEIYFSDSKIGQQSFETEFIINCTGPESDYLKIPSVLVQNLVKNGVFTPDSIHYGINAAKNGEISPNFYTLGPPLKGILWESTAVLEIRHQAKELAAKIICN
jgi:uncharacterized NAD(P)/FAD-binding protein YdhS